MAELLAKAARLCRFKAFLQDKTKTCKLCKLQNFDNQFHCKFFYGIRAWRLNIARDDNVNSAF